jgi:glucose-6-phosphate 1-dehydrogenase
MPEMPAQNPLTTGLDELLLPQPCSLVIFGASGDLTRRKLLPAVYNLAVDGVLPTPYAVVGVARTDMDDEGFRAVARRGIEDYSRQSLDEACWSDYARALFYVSGSFDSPEAFSALKHRLEDIEREHGIPGNRVFYLAVPPSVIEHYVTQLRAAGLVAPPERTEPFSRVIVEKPVGHDLDSARDINVTLARVFAERQIFRIDHYLGKETVQNIMVMRFANAIFEPLWNQKYIDHVQITVAEAEGVGTRGGYYDEAGALRDMVQNHILQLLCLTAMEPPWSMTADVVRDHRLAVLHCLRPLRDAAVERYVVRAQYGPGFHQGAQVPGYSQEERVRLDSTTETYVAIKLFVDNWRWAGVPFYVRTGKCLPQRVSEIAVQFKNVPPILFNSKMSDPLEPNVLAVRLQPDEGLSLRIACKRPGAKVSVSPVKLDFHYGETFGEQSPEAYERLLLDVMAGDATLFMRRDAVEASWAWVTDILTAWEQAGTHRLPEYTAGTWGPTEAEELIGADNRRWRTL